MTAATHTDPHAAAGPDLHSLMGIPLPNGKLAMWFFLVTEIMFFTALIGTYLIIRNSIPTDPAGLIKWPNPESVHLSELIGAINTFVLIASSLTVVLAHYAATSGKFKNATLWILATTALGTVFLVIKGFEYNAKISHDILPGKVSELLPGMSEMRQRQFHNVGMQYVERVRGQLEHAVLHGTGKESIADVKDADVEGASELVRECWDLHKNLIGVLSEDKTSYRRPLTPAEVGGRVNHILHVQHDKLKAGEIKSEEIHLSPAIPYGNMWSSCYFAMTGFHALHVLGGIVIFVIILGIGFLRGLGPQHTDMLEITGLYWHFVDIVWIFLFPLLYLI
jgi:cytochrome c oxidase subunit 3